MQHESLEIAACGLAVFAVCPEQRRKLLAQGYANAKTSFDLFTFSLALEGHCPKLD